MHREYRPADMSDLRAHAFGGHDHGRHHHGHSHSDPNRHDQVLLVLTGLLGLLLGGEVLFGWLGWESWRAPWGVSLALIAAVIGGARIVYTALEALLQGRIGADVALAQACIAALVIGQPLVAAEVVFIALVGELLEAVSFARAQKAIHRLLDASPRTARVRREGAEVEIPAAEVRVEDLVIVRPGEKIAVDGEVVVGRSTVDQSALTGEPMAVDRGPGERVYSGTLNQFGVLEVRAERVGHETTLGQVFRLVAEAQRKKAPLERVADRLARYFLPVVETVAALTLLFGYTLGWPDVWLRTVAVLVVACPCALILATPAAVFASMAWLARHGVLIKGGAALERLATCDALAFDKTGTLTLGRPELAEIVPAAGRTEAELLRLAATAESSSSHPLGVVVMAEAARRGIAPWALTESLALPGAGISASFREVPEGPPRTVLVGNRRLLEERGVTLDEATVRILDGLDERGETPLIVVADGNIAGLLSVRDAVRPEAHDVVHELKQLGLKEVAILTGDRARAAQVVARKTHIKTVVAELLPADKARWIEQRQAEGRRVAMVGDGINDAAALAAAHVGIALGGIGADLAAEAGDLIVLGEPLLVLPDLVRLSRATVRVIRQNIVGFAFGLNAVAMASAALGVLGPVAAAVLHQVGSLLVLLNAMRLLAFGDFAEMTPWRQLRGLGASIRRFDDRNDLALLATRLLNGWRGIAAAGIGLAVLVYGLSGLTIIEAGEAGLVQRFGRHIGTLGPGLHWRLPPPLERVVRLAVDRVRGVEVGFRSGGGDRDGLRWESGHGRTVTVRAEEESLLLTGDGQLVELTAAAQYRLDARSPATLRAFAFGVADPEAALRPMAESAVRSVVSRSKLEELLTSSRHAAELEAAAQLQERIEIARVGIVVTALAFQDVHPPLTVVDAYRDASRAESDRQRRGNEGLTYQAETLAAARGKAAETTDRAEVERARRESRAKAESDVFRDVASARASRPRLTDRRLYWNLLVETLAGKRKLVLDPGRASPRRLIVPDGPGSSGRAALDPLEPLVGPPKPVP